MKLTPQERQVLAHWLRGKMNKQIAYDMDLSAETVKVYLRRVYRKIGATHGREAMAIMIRSVANAAWAPPGDHITVGIYDPIAHIIDTLANDQNNDPDAYSFTSLALDDLRQTQDDPLGEFMAYYDGLGDRPRLPAVEQERLAQFHPDIERYHWIADIDLRETDGDFNKFRFVSGGRGQPTVRGREDTRNLLIANHPFEPLAIELSSRLGLTALTHRTAYQRGELRRAGKTWSYRCLTVPLFDADTCTRALTVFHRLPDSA